MDNLDSCPFCRSDAELVVCTECDTSQFPANFAFVRCTGCYAQTNKYAVDYTNPDKTIDHVIFLWNRRSPSIKQSKNHWVIDSVGCRCSNCGIRLPSGILSQIDFHFCPNCGAPM